MFHLIINANKLNDTGKTGKATQEKLSAIERVFEKAGRKVVLHTTEYAGHATRIAKELTSGEEVVNLVAIGGDGTLHEVLNGVTDVEKCTLGLIPLGSGNDFAETARIPVDAEEAAKVIAFRSPTKIDYIELGSGVRSINAVGMGIDVDVLKRTYSGKKTGKDKYLSAFVKSLMHYKAGRYKVVYDGKEEEHAGIICCLGNGRQIGGGIMLFPEADIRDGYIDLVFVDCISKFSTLFAFAKLKAGKINKVKQVTHVKCKQVNVTPLGDTSTTIQAEGELYENTALNAHIVEGKLAFYLPDND